MMAQVGNPGLQIDGLPYAAAQRGARQSPRPYHHVIAHQLTTAPARFQPRGSDEYADVSVRGPDVRGECSLPLP